MVQLGAGRALQQLCLDRRVIDALSRHDDVATHGADTLLNTESMQALASDRFELGSVYELIAPTRRTSCLRRRRPETRRPRRVRPRPTHARPYPLWFNRPLPALYIYIYKFILRLQARGPLSLDVGSEYCD